VLVGDHRLIYPRSLNFPLLIEQETDGIVNEVCPDSLEVMHSNLSGKHESLAGRDMLGWGCFVSPPPLLWILAFIIFRKEGIY